MIDYRLVGAKLKSVQALGHGSVESNIIFIDEWWDKFGVVNPSIDLFMTYVRRSKLDENKIYLTCAQKKWMYSEDEWYESLAMEINLIRPRAVVILGNRCVRRIVLKVKDMVKGFRWFYEVQSHHVVKRFYHDDQFYIDQLDQLAKDFQYSDELEDSANLKLLSFLP